MKVESFKQFTLKMLRCNARVFPVGTLQKQSCHVSIWLVQLRDYPYYV